jgi:hypothetical protein
MATETELDALEDELRKLVIEASKHEDLTHIDDMQKFVERVLTQSGYVLRGDRWVPAEH